MVSKPAQHQGRLWLAILLAASPALFFYGALLHWSTTIPLADDYTALLRFALVWRTSSSQFLAFIAAQDGDYKLLLDHAMVVLDLSATHNLHLGLYLLFGNLFPLLVGWTLWKHTASSEAILWRRVLIFAPVTFLLFQLNYAETLNWAMGGMQNLSVISFAFLAIHLLLRRKPVCDLAASIAAMVACCGSANGFVLFPIGAYLLLSRRAWLSLTGWTAAFITIAAAYLYRISIYPKRRTSPAELLHFALSFLGGGVETMRGKPIAGASVLLGTLLLLFLAFAFSKRIDRDAPFAFYSCLWVLLTVCLVTLGRSGFGIQIALSGRYKIYSDLLLVFAYLFVLALRNRRAGTWHGIKGIVAVAMLAAIAMCLGSDLAGARLLQERREKLREGVAVYLRSGGTIPPMQDTSVPPHTAYTPIEIAARDLLNAARSSGIYQLPLP